jgi:outer membrane protein assembly factor BamB
MKYVKYLILIVLLAISANSPIWSRSSKTEDIEPSHANIRLSQEAEELIQNARKEETEKQWITAVNDYQKASEIYSQYVINQSPVNNSKEAALGYNDLYWGVKYVCQSALRKLPLEGRKIYQQIFDPPAKHLFEQSGISINNNSTSGFIDTVPLSVLSEKYPLTEYGEKALIVLIRWCLEESELYAASGYYKQLLAYHPESLDKLRPIESAIIVNYLNNKQLAHINKAGEWKTYSGNNTRSQLSHSPSNENFTPYAYFELPQIAYLPNYQPYYYPPSSRPNTYSNAIPYFPIVNNELIYIPAGLGICVLDLKNPKLRITFDKSEIYKLQANWKFFHISDSDTKTFFEERTINTATLSEDGARLYAPIITSFEEHEQQFGYLEVKYPFPRRILYAFNTQTGRIMWTTDKIVSENIDGDPKNILFPVAPAVEDDVLYAAGINMAHQTDIPEHYVFALGSFSGKAYFKTFIASGILETNLFNNPSREPIASAVTVDDENIYYCSQMGAIVAIDKYSGTLKWLKKYEQYSLPPVDPNNPNSYVIPPRLPLRWINNPIIYTDFSKSGSSQSVDTNSGQIVFTAIDSPFIVMLSAKDGKEIWRLDADALQLGNIRYIIGIKDNLLIVSGESGVVCLDITKKGKIEWLLQGHKFIGKGALTDNRLFITSDSSLLEIILETGKISKEYDLKANGRFPASGNILFSNNYLILTSSQQLSIYK